jgi:hypothetical protein
MSTAPFNLPGSAQGIDFLNAFEDPGELNISNNAAAYASSSLFSGGLGAVMDQQPSQSSGSGSEGIFGLPTMDQLFSDNAALNPTPSTQAITPNAATSAFCNAVSSIMGAPSSTAFCAPYVTGGSANSTSNTPSNSSGLFGSTFAGFSFGRIAAFIIGIVFIGGGIYLFGKQPISEAATGLIRTGAAF